MKKWPTSFGQTAILERQSRKDGRVASAAAPVFFFGWGVRVETKYKKRDARGRFAGASADEQNAGPVTGKPAAVGAPRPRYCREYARKRLAEAAPKLVDAFLKKSIGGSVQHLKVLLEMTGIAKEPVVPVVKKRRGKTIAQQLLEELGE